MASVQQVGEQIMSVYMIETSMSTEFICEMFSFLAICEAKKEIGLDCNLQNGLQYGYIKCYADMFGTEDVHTSRGGWWNVVSKIIEQEQVTALLHVISNNKSDNSIHEDDLDILECTVRKAVVEWINDNEQIARNSIQSI